MNFVSKFFLSRNIKLQIVLRYTVALFIIACMAFISNRITDKMLFEQEKYSEIINISGRQRMLSQRISLLCYCIFNNKGISINSKPIENEIIQLATIMKESNIYLDKKRLELGINKASDLKFNEKIQNFTNKAIECAKTRNCQKFINEFNYEYISTLLKESNVNVEDFSIKSRSEIQMILNFSKFILFLTILTLIIEAFFIFKPMVKRIMLQIQELEHKNKVIHETNTKLEFEMNAARLAMGNLLPKVDLINNFDNNLDISYYYQSAESVGGDLWGVYKFGNKKMILIGDVTGHGAGSAVIASAVSGFMESVSSSELNNVETLKSIYVDLSNFINKIGDNSFYMTMAMVVFDEDMKNFSFINAAHNFPFLIDYTDAANCSVKRLVLGGYRLGNKIENTERDEIKINSYEFNESTILILFTDGLIENTNERGNEYGENRIKKLVKSKKYNTHQSSILIKDIIEDAYTFYNKHIIVDDVTLVVIKMNTA